MRERPEKSENKGGRRGQSWLGYIMAGVVAALLSVLLYGGGLYLYKRFMSTEDDISNAVLAQEISSQGVEELKKTSESFRAVVKHVLPAVVKIEAVKGQKRRQRSHRFFPFGRGDDEDEEDRRSGPFSDPFFDFFFRGPFFDTPPSQPQHSLGSGIIISERGYVVTNNHVVAGADKVVVKISKGADEENEVEYKAKIVGTDSKTDLAVLKIEGGPFPFVEWADSSEVEVGDWAIAIGSPFTLTHTVTVGIVSAKGRPSNIIGGSYADLIQTDAAINPGNSGGPLCTIEGKVMGVNTAIYTRSGGYMGIGFAIPSNVAKDIVERLIREGKVVRGWLGVFIQPVDEELRKELRIEGGVSIHKVVVDSPAQKAGLKAGDVILSVDGKKVASTSKLQRIIGSFRPGQRVKIEVLSYTDRKRRTVTVTIGELPEEGEELAQASEKSDEIERLGLKVADDPKGRGVVVVRVYRMGIADQVGLEKGDIITHVNRRRIRSVSDLKKALKGSSRHVSLIVKRKGMDMFFRFTLPQ